MEADSPRAGALPHPQMDEREFDRYLEDLCQRYEAQKGDHLVFADLAPLLQEVAVALLACKEHLISAHTDAEPWIDPSYRLLRETVRQYTTRQGGEVYISGSMLSFALSDIFAFCIRDDEVEARAQAQRQTTMMLHNQQRRLTTRRISCAVVQGKKWRERADEGAAEAQGGEAKRAPVVYSCLSQSVEDPSIKRLRVTQERIETKQRIIAGLKNDAGETDWRDLTTLRELFFTQLPCGFVGLTQDEFRQLFETAPGRGVYKGPFEGLSDPDRIFSMLDADGGGYLDWDEFSTYLIASQLREDPEVDDGDGGGGMYLPAEGRLVTENKTHSLATTTKLLDPNRHSKPITHVAVHSDFDMYFSACLEGYVKAWRATTVAYMEDVLRPPDQDSAGRALVVGMLIIPGTQSALLVAKNNRVVHTFSCHNEGTIPLRVFVGTAVLTTQTTSTYVPAYVRDAAKTRFHDHGGTKSNDLRCKRTMNNFCVLADFQTDHLTAVALLSFPIDGGEGDSVLALGSDTGCVYLYGLAWFASTSKCMFHYRHPGRLEITALSTLAEKRALVISYSDCSVRWIAVDKKTVLFEANLGVDGKPGVHGLTALSLCPEVNLCASSCGQRIDVGNTSAVRQHALYHRSLVVALGWICIDKNYYLFSLSGEDRMLYVWESRNFRLVQSMRITHTDPGRESEPLRGFVYDRAHGRLLICGRTRIVVCNVGRSKPREEAMLNLQEAALRRAAGLPPESPRGVMSPKGRQPQAQAQAQALPESESNAPLNTPPSPVDSTDAAGEQVAQHPGRRRLAPFRLDHPTATDFAGTGGGGGGGGGPGHCRALFYDPLMEHLFAVVGEHHIVVWDICRGTPVGELNLDTASGALTIITAALYRTSTRSLNTAGGRISPVLILGNYHEKRDPGGQHRGSSAAGDSTSPSPLSQTPRSDVPPSAAGPAAPPHPAPVRQLGLWDSGAGVRVATFGGIEKLIDLRDVKRLPGTVVAAGGNVCVLWRNCPSSTVAEVEIEPAQRINVRDGFIVSLHWCADAKVLGISTSWAYMEYASRDLDDPMEEFRHVRTLDLRSFLSARTTGVGAESPKAGGGAEVARTGAGAGAGGMTSGDETPLSKKSPSGGLRRRVKMMRTFNRRATGASEATSMASPHRGGGRFLPPIAGVQEEGPRTLWMRVREALGFNKTSAPWQELLEKIRASLTVPSVAYLRPGLFVTCKTSSYVVVWEDAGGHDRGKMKATSCFHGAYSRSEVVTQLAWIPAQKRIVCGDSTGYVSVFEFKDMLDHLAKQGRMVEANFEQQQRTARDAADVDRAKKALLHVTPKLAEIKRRAALRTFIRDPTKPPPENQDCILQFLRPTLTSCYRAHATAVQQLHVVVKNLNLIFSLAEGYQAAIYQATGLPVAVVNLATGPEQFAGLWPIVVSKQGQAAVATERATAGLKQRERDARDGRRASAESAMMSDAVSPRSPRPGTSDIQGSNLTKSHSNCHSPRGRVVMYSNSLVAQLVQPSNEPSPPKKKSVALAVLKKKSYQPPSLWDIAMGTLAKSPYSNTTITHHHDAGAVGSSPGMDDLERLGSGELARSVLPPITDDAVVARGESPTRALDLSDDARYFVP